MERKSPELVWSEAEGQFIDLANDLQPASTPASDHEPRTAPSGRVLVVEDDAGVREVLAEMLRNTGLQVHCATDGEAGWEALCAERFDLVITDHAMPRLKGLDLLRRMRTSSHDAPAIMISGEMPWQDSDFVQLLPPGMALEKPFSMIDLLAKVRIALTPATHDSAGRIAASLAERDSPP
jgi:DNA-binding response OmpR family regulator